jgi:hypothetical protein
VFGIGKLLDSLFARNETEHNKNNNPSQNKASRTNWMDKNKIGSFQNNPYKTTTQEELMDLPLDNLHMILDNISLLQERKQRTK